MSTLASEVSLVSGEKVQLALGSVCYPEQVFVRMSTNLIVGVIEDSERPMLYIWELHEGVYKYQGNIDFRDQGDGTTMWVLIVRDKQENLQKNAALIAEVAELYQAGGTPHLKILSSARK